MSLLSNDEGLDSELNGRLKIFLDTINIRVKDVEATLAFYQGVLGLQPDRLDDFRAGQRPSPDAV